MARFYLSDVDQIQMRTTRTNVHILGLILMTCTLLFEPLIIQYARAEET